MVGVKARCNCKNSRSLLSDDHKLKLFQEIHNLDAVSENTYLPGLLTVLPVNEDAMDSMRQQRVAADSVL
ncbi:hypothetical protein JTB14_002815 [Gonioctena quinquepunctata]|nr:hypothetical protein JTB14_002815 [Gonioctena quinquepunctata]